MSPRAKPRGPFALPLAQRCATPLAARFVARPNRFVAEVELACGEIVDVHVPNPGRLTGTLTPGCRVLLDGPYPPPRRLRYTMLAAREGRTWVGTVTTFANRAFPLLWRAGLFPELAAPGLEAEVTHGRSRFDFKAGAHFVEVKSVTLGRTARRSRGATFPDAVTARGARHCDELAAMARRGHRPAIVFVAQRGDVDWIAPEDDVDPVFGRALRGAARAGVRILGSAIELGPQGLVSARRVEVRLDGG